MSRCFTYQRMFCASPSLQRRFQEHQQRFRLRNRMRKSRYPWLQLAREPRPSSQSQRNQCCPNRRIPTSNRTFQSSGSFHRRSTHRRQRARQLCTRQFGLQRVPRTLSRPLLDLKWWVRELMLPAHQLRFPDLRIIGPTMLHHRRNQRRRLFRTRTLLCPIPLPTK